MIEKVVNQVLLIHREFLLDGFKHGDPAIKIHPAAIVGIHQPQILQLRALIKIRYTRSHNLQQELRQAIHRPVISDLPLERLEVLHELRPFLGQDAGNESLQCFFRVQRV